MPLEPLMISVRVLANEKRMMRPGLRGHLRERTCDLRISQHRESLDPGLHRANRAAQQREDHLLEQLSAHRTKANACETSSASVDLSL
jgi:hypothetical protein